VDIIVITGTGRAFATGGDLHEVLARIDDQNPLACMPTTTTCRSRR
jgi:enoyl-CoA hydratase/carnithine racemase